MINKMNEKFKDKLATVPNKPGCYQMKDKDGVIIYVGKAKNLHNRVSSYFIGSHDYKTTKMVSLIDDFEYIITSSELEAFILENNLIKKYDPKYNILATDDKTYPYICLTNEAHPRLIYTRSVNKKLGKYYGPYPNAYSCKMVCEKLNKLYPLRKCRLIPKKECLYYHLHQCLGPCIKDIDTSIYEEYKMHIDNLLSGKAKEEISYLTKQMNEASEALDFEKAIELRNLLDDVNVVIQKQNMEGYLEDSDIFGYYENEEFVSIQVFHLREGKILERNGYLYDKIGDGKEIFNDFVVKFYLDLNNPLPKNIYILDGEAEDISNLIKHSVIIPKKGKYKELMNLVCENAKNKIDEIIKKRDIEYKKSGGAVEELSNLLGLPYLKVIEAFDNSNISGASPVSAMVAFVDGKKANKLYRRFKVKTVEGANDAATMFEVVTRRYKDLENNPNLIIMDGGAIQVNSCLSALSKLGRTIPVLGLVKDDKHQTRALYYEGKEIVIDKNSYTFKLLYEIQEEVHRYAISYFHSAHTKNMIYSKLESIKGIGKVKREKILYLVGSNTFEEDLKALHLNEEQIEEVKNIFKNR
ncbi:MAG: excinuclease ABC subunit C [Bacilli bacterium]|nr:excinuclease ABC subunit C [Bacilli bacterium]